MTQNEYYNVKEKLKSLLAEMEKLPDGYEKSVLIDKLSDISSFMWLSLEGSDDY